MFVRNIQIANFTDIVVLLNILSSLFVVSPSRPRWKEISKFILHKESFFKSIHLKSLANVLSIASNGRTNRIINKLSHSKLHTEQLFLVVCFLLHITSVNEI